MTTILGPGSSEITERFARILGGKNVVQISYGATSPALSDRTNFPKFFRTVSPDSSHTAALLAFVLHHKWYKVATLHEQDDKYSMSMTKLYSDLERVNITLALTRSVSERDYKNQLQLIRAQDCRIIICNFSPSLYRKIFCEAHRMGMYGGDHAWILIGDSAESQWHNVSDPVCDDDQLKEATQGVISIGSLYDVVDEQTPVSETTLPEILQEIEFHSDSKSSGYIAQTYDAVWAMALALKESEEYWKATNSSLTLKDFTYDNSLIADRIAKTISNLNFVGISGPISFHKSDRIGITAFHQRQGDKQQLIAIYTPDSPWLNFNCSNCSKAEWQGLSSFPFSRSYIYLIMDSQKLELV
ncbi:gamma-aminobutyric acid type B receptor subunit 1 [Caerostris darwini]|uniref:Gamma-aminobutyric acid type B receptor subunit 1 n=1 Tax=Caerostris darwini TaxID=1538125 RepID=A0AAV4PSV9_9ARAC|nr:gamma-aminobutyric acid type B receptor subunit 1 [Caerostris darwini]